jgi:hypothetical protein
MRKRFKLYTIFGGVEPHRWLTDAEICALTISSAGVAQGESPNEDQVQTAIAYLNKYAKQLKGTTDSGVGSYGLKHRVERWGRENGLQPYVTNGAAIEAVRRMGWPIAVSETQDGAMRINAYLGLKERPTHRYVGRRMTRVPA